MDPATALPLHFTLEAIGIGGAALVLVWATTNKQWPVALGALALGVGQALHAGQFLTSDDGGVLIGLRFGGIALLAIAAVTVADDRWLYASGLGVLFAGAVWSALAGGSAEDLDVGPHVLIAVGSAALVVWVWWRTRGSVRLRVVAAFVAVLSLTIVVAGGAVARAAATDARATQLHEIGVAASATGGVLTGFARQLERRAALGSPTVAQDPNAVQSIAPNDDESAAVIDGSGRVLAKVGKVGKPSFPFAHNVRAIAAAYDGTTHVGFEIRSGVLYLLGAAPVFRAGTQGTPADVFAVLAISRATLPSGLLTTAQAYDAGAEVTVSQDGRTVRTGDTSRPGLLRVTTTLPQSDVRLEVAAPGSRATAAATTLIRALLIALLAAALLAVVVATWLADRVSRPIIDLAVEAERAKTEFLANVSHELRTPLTPIRGYTELLRRGRVPPRRATGYLDEIGQATGRLERIITLLTDVAAMDAGRFPIEIDDVVVSELFDDAAARWRGVSKQHTIEAGDATSLPAVRGDGSVLSRVLDELIDNAVKFSPDGGTVVLAGRRTRNGVELSVGDAGVGLDATTAKEMTRAFTQAEGGSVRRFGGLGLGLAYVNGALRAHGSRLQIAGEEGGGATFSFVLPAAGSVTRMPARGASNQRTRSAR